MSRLCDRPICGQPADVTLTYSYEDGTVWLDPLAADDHPMTHDLCDRHAATLRVPRGWGLEDRRTGAPSPDAEPAPPAEPELAATA